MQLLVRLAAAFLLGAIWPMAVMIHVLLIENVTYPLLTLFRFSDLSSLALADRLATATVSTVLAGTVFGFTLAALAHRKPAAVLVAFLTATLLSFLLFFPLQGYDPSAIEISGEDVSPASWLGLFVALWLAWVRHNVDAKSKGASVAP